MSNSAKMGLRAGDQEKGFWRVKRNYYTLICCFNTRKTVNPFPQRALSLSSERETDQYTVINVCVCVCVCVCVLVTHSYPTLCDPMDIQSMEFSGQNTGVGSLSLLQGIFPTQGSNPSLPHCRRILYPLSYEGSPSWTLWADKMVLQIKCNLWKVHIYKSDSRVSLVAQQ